MKLNTPIRLAAGLALINYALIVYFIFVLVISSPLLLTLLVATSIGVLYALWIIFTGTEKRLRKGLLLLIAFLTLWVLELILIAQQGGSLKIVLIIAALSLSYTLLVSYLRREYIATVRKHNSQSKDIANFNKPYLIINPKSGNGRATKAKVAKHAQDQGITVYVLKKTDDVEKLARDAAKAGADVLGVSGGDGSIGAVVKVALEYKLPVVVLAGGTRCHFARDMGLDPKQILDGLNGFKGVERRIDVGDINGRIFLNNASFGLYADIVDNPNYRENKVAITRQVLKDTLARKKQGYPLIFKNRNKHYKRAIQVLVGVNRYKTVNLMEMGEREQLDQGVLQVTAITKLNDNLVKQLLKVFSIDFTGGIEKVDGIDQWETKNFTVSSDKKSIVVGVDGEREVYSSPVNITVRPRALRVYVPAEGTRSRPKKAFTPTTLSRIWKIMLGKNVTK